MFKFSFPKCLVLLHLTRVSHHGIAGTVSAGQLSGVTPGIKFIVYDESKLDVVLATLVVIRSRSSDADLGFIDAQQQLDDIPMDAVAVQLTSVPEADKLRLAVEDDNLWKLCIAEEEDLTTGQIGTRNFDRATSMEQADMSVSLEGHYVVFKLLYKECIDNGLTCMASYCKVQPHSHAVKHVLRSAAHFCLNLHSSPSSLEFAKQNVFECYKLDETRYPRAPREEAANVIVTSSPDEIAGRPSTVGTIRLSHDAGGQYGFQLHNRSRHDLYASIFYFDCSDLSICEFFFFRKYTKLPITC